MNEPAQRPTAWMGEGEAEALAQRVAAAVRERDWSVVIDLVESDWPRLLTVAVSALDEALRALPAEVVAQHPIVVAVREIRLHVRGDTRELDRQADRVIPVSSPVELRKLGRGPAGRRAMSAAAAYTVAYRVHGRYRQALRFAAITEELTRHARVSHPDEIALRAPSALAQIGITRMLGGDHHAASVNLKEAYELRDESWDARLGRDAAGKLALLYAVRGDTVRAQRWRSRYDEQAETTGWMEPLVHLSATVASALIAIDRLDQAAADAALTELELRVNRERSWAPYATYAHARYGLYWGDRRAALERIQRVRDFAGHDDEPAAIEPYLDALRADLLLASGRLDDARDLLADREATPQLAAVAARLAMMTGRVSDARELSAEGLSHDDLDPRTQTDLLLLAALSASSREDARRQLQQALATAVRTRGLAPFSFADRSSVRQLVAELAPSPETQWLETALASAPTPMPPPGDARTIGLTPIERRVLTLVIDGASRRGIAHALFVSENTVKFHLRNVYRKLSVSSRSDAVAAVHRLELVLEDNP